MRLVCPNCDATYEVPDAVIPDEGRDVQCSNCGNSWFVDPHAPEETDADIAAAVEAVTRQVPPTPEPEPELPPVQTPIAGIQQPPHPSAHLPQAGAPVEQNTLRRRTLEPDVADVLRQEAAYEARARADETGIEIQEDLPLAPPPEPAPLEVDTEAALKASGSRRDLLPDIDEINSTLRATSERGSAAGVAEEISATARQRRGFRLGFGLVLFVLGAFAAGYSYAPDISTNVPQLESLLLSYVDMVNSGRAWLEDSVAGLVERLGT